MTSRASTRKHAAGNERRPGFTLLELLLVLAVVLLVVAISWPSLESWFQAHRLQQGVDLVREHWIMGRTLAMKEGRPYRFGFVLNGTAFRLAPDEIESWPELSGMSNGPRQSGFGMPEGTVVEEELPNGVIFWDWENAQSGLGEGSGGWSQEAIVFWPDGQARLASADGQEKTETIVLLRDRAGRAKGLHVRAITGVVSEHRVEQ
jgi:prepilin-type N-terminal cleavage/methylation domain-containing protein